MAARKGKGEPPAKEDVQVKLPDNYLFTLMKMKLNENDCRNRGYILDGFPRTYKDCQNLFLTKPPKKDDEEEDAADEEEEGAEKNWSKYILDTLIAPKNFICLEGQNDFLKTRVKELPEETTAGTHWNEEGMNRRLKAYRDANENEEGNPSVKDFFE